MSTVLSTAGVRRRRSSSPRRPRDRARAGYGYNPKIFLSPASFMNSVTKMRNLHHVQTSKTLIRLNFTTTFSNRTNSNSSNGPARYLEASSGQSSPQTVASTVFSSNGSTSSRSTPTSHNSITEYPTHRTQLRSNPRLQVASLPTAPRNRRSYQLYVVQHPQRTAEFGYASLSRLPLTPPMVVQLMVRDANGNSVVPQDELPFLIAHLSLFAENGTTPLDMGSSTTGQGYRQAAPPPILYGNLVSSVDYLEDQNGNKGLFFIFPDVSIRWRGRFQLGITLVRISRPDSPGIAEQGTTLAQARTGTFEVLPRHEYIAAPQTRLTQAFLRQGARMFSLQ
ncbi:velvet factor-domain-containing protein [Mycena albidolilacea]|uniref:Velvet factor-domain-containing protein n=1 Tax=Mycena albidolilacea TaxID=1033008 RepID=A0AAD7EWU6_9AGAR|nr:velvet factor-domain-containing protein [Mycena albidolilacea]